MQFNYVLSGAKSSSAPKHLLLPLKTASHLPFHVREDLSWRVNLPRSKTHGLNNIALHVLKIIFHTVQLNLNSSGLSYRADWLLFISRPGITCQKSGIEQHSCEHFESSTNWYDLKPHKQTLSYLQRETASLRYSYSDLLNKRQDFQILDLKHKAAWHKRSFIATWSQDYTRVRIYFKIHTRIDLLQQRPWQSNYEFIYNQLVSKLDNFNLKVRYGIKEILTTDLHPKSTEHNRTDHRGIALLFL